MELDSTRRQALLNVLDSRWRTTGELVEKSNVKVCLPKASQMLTQYVTVGKAERQYKCRGTWLQPLWRKHA